MNQRRPLDPFISAMIRRMKLTLRNKLWAKIRNRSATKRLVIQKVIANSYSEVFSMNFISYIKGHP